MNNIEEKINDLLLSMGKNRIEDLYKNVNITMTNVETGYEINFYATKEEMEKFMHKLLTYFGFKKDDDFDMFDIKYKDYLVNRSNTYNYDDIFLPVNFEKRIFDVEKLTNGKHKYLVAISPHLGDDIRTGYYETYIKYYDNIDYYDFKPKINELIYDLISFDGELEITFIDNSKLVVLFDHGGYILNCYSEESKDDKGDTIAEKIEEILKSDENLYEQDVFNLFSI